MLLITPDLAQQAQTAIAQVGQAPVTGDCAGKLELALHRHHHDDRCAHHHDHDGRGGHGRGSTDGGSGAPEHEQPGGHRSPPGQAYRSVSVGTSPASTPAAPNTATPAADVKLTSVPAFAGRRSVSWAGPLLALLGLICSAGLPR